MAGAGEAARVGSQPCGLHGAPSTAVLLFGDEPAVREMVSWKPALGLSVCFSRINF